MPPSLKTVLQRTLKPGHEVIDVVGVGADSETASRVEQASSSRSPKPNPSPKPKPSLTLTLSLTLPLTPNPTLTPDQEQEYMSADMNTLPALAAAVVRRELGAAKGSGKVVVFCPTANQAQFVSELFEEMGIANSALHSRKSQAYRSRVSLEFRDAREAVPTSTSSNPNPNSNPHSQPQPYPYPVPLTRCWSPLTWRRAVSTTLT